MKTLIQKWRQMPASAKSSIAFVLSSFVLKGISFLTTPIFTRLMDQTQYGIIAEYNSWLSIIDVFALLGLTSAGVFNVGLNDYRDSRDQYISSILTLCNLTTIGVFGILWAARMVMGPDFLLPDSLLLLMFIHFIFSPAQVFWITRQKYEFKYKAAFLTTVGSTLISQVLSMILVKNILENQGAVRLWSSEIGALLFTVPIYLMLCWRGKKFINFPLWKQVLVFALPLIPHYLAQHIMSSADRIMVAEMVSEADAGIYSVVANISMVATIVWSAINGSLIAYTFENLREKAYAKINSTATMLILGYGVVCFGICLIAPEVLAILAPEEYYSGIYAVPPIAGVAFLSALYNIFANIEFYHKKSTYITISTITASVINFVLNWILIPRYSFVAASYTTLFSYIVLVFMHYRGYRKSTPDRIYNGRNFLLVSAGSILACLCCNLLYGNTMLRWGIILIMGVAVLWKHKFILNLIKSLRK